MNQEQADRLESYLPRNLVKALKPSVNGDYSTTCLMAWLAYTAAMNATDDKLLDQHMDYAELMFDWHDNYDPTPYIAETKQ